MPTTVSAGEEKSGSHPRILYAVVVVVITAMFLSLQQRRRRLKPDMFK